MFYYMHNNTNYQCKICWNKALTFGVGSIQLSFRIYIPLCSPHMFSIQMLLHFSQIVPRVCTLVLSFKTVMNLPLRRSRPSDTTSSFNMRIFFATHSRKPSYNQLELMCHKQQLIQGFKLTHVATQTKLYTKCHLL